MNIATYCCALLFINPLALACPVAATPDLGHLERYAVIFSGRVVQVHDSAVERQAFEQRAKGMDITPTYHAQVMPLHILQGSASNQTLRITTGGCGVAVAVAVAVPNDAGVFFAEKKTGFTVPVFLGASELADYEKSLTVWLKALSASANAAAR